MGAGVGPKAIDEVWGVAKAYVTRVGEGPFPTELDDEIGRHMLERGHEYGTTTGRQRRCGWLDLVALRYAARVNGLTGLVITKLDVLAGIDPLQVCTRYRHGEGAVFDDFPYHQSILHSAEAVNEELPGFEDDIGECRTIADLPVPARDYLAFVADFVGVPVKLVGVGPGPRPGDLGGRRAAAARSRVAPALRGRVARRPAADFLADPSPAGDTAAQLVQLMVCSRTGGGSSWRSSMLRSPRRRMRSASMPAAISDAVASVIWTPTRPSRDQ